MLAMVEHIKNSTQLRWNKVHKFKTKVHLHLEVGPYIVKTAQSFEELVESFKLRHEIFNCEFRGMKGRGLDFDKYDYFFDHLIILHRDTNKIIGTYRLNCSQFSDESYTENEFELSLLRLYPGNRLELGRACIQKEYRKGAVISLLWRGIAEYLNQSDARIVYGCSSIKMTTARESALLYKYLLDEGHVTHEYLCRPTRDFEMRQFDSWFNLFKDGLNDKNKKEAENSVPSLLRSYLKIGAKIACEPAYDKDFNCIDLLTVLRREDIMKSLAEKFSVIR